MISHIRLCRYPPIRVFRVIHTPCWSKIWISGIEAELGVSTYNNIDTVNIVIDRKENDRKRCLISREFPLFISTLFWLKSKLFCIRSSATIRSWRKFRKYLFIVKHEILDNQGELGLQTSCIVLVRGILIEIPQEITSRKCRKMRVKSKILKNWSYDINNQYLQI